MNSISILGCGWLGLPLATHLINNGYKVKGSTTRQERLIHLKECGITPFLIDITKENTIDNEFLQSTILIIAIPSKNILGFKHLLKSINKSAIKKILFISSTSVYPNINKEIKENDAVIAEHPLITIENKFKEIKTYKTTIIRFAGLVGGKRHPGNWFEEKEIPNPEGYVNMIHREDCIQIITSIIDKEIWGETFNACCPHHPTRRMFYTQAKKSLQKKAPTFKESSEQIYKLISSEKLQEQLNYKFRHNNLLRYLE